MYLRMSDPVHRGGHAGSESRRPAFYRLTELLTRTAESGRRGSNPRDQLGRLAAYSGRPLQLAPVTRRYSVSAPLAVMLGRNSGRRSPLPGICGDRWSVAGFRAPQHPRSVDRRASVLSLSLLKVRDRHDESLSAVSAADGSAADSGVTIRPQVLGSRAVPDSPFWRWEALATGARRAGA